ncbi:MAG: DoxX family membrane protein [Mycobacterium sp.]|nr:DoxX family membrane protein [Mycobacterium sp.]MBV9353266.1 DoxX family membrane protein [Mycobacterium sp.]
MSVDRATATRAAGQFNDPTFQAYALLRMLFTVAPILFGLDKFFNVLTHPDHWSKYLAGWINGIVPGNADQCMYIVGVIEIVAGVLVAIAPRIGAWVVAAWLAGIIVDLLTLSGYYDIALRDFGLLVSAVALARLAQSFHHTERT